MADRRKSSVSPETQRRMSKRASVRISFAQVEERQQSKAVGVARKAMPYVAVCVFFLTFVVFMWVVPCRWGGCPSMCSRDRIKSWQTELRALELKGGVVDVPGLHRGSRNLVFLARCRVLLQDLDEGVSGDFCNPATDGGLLSLAGSSGTTAWWRPLHGLPSVVNCSLVDVNENGVFDCLVVGDNGLLDAVDPVSGVVLWYMHSVNTLQRPVDLAFPLVLPDLDGDDIAELLVPCKIADESQFLPVVTKHRNLVLVSGKTGRTLGRPYKTPMCLRISSLQIHNLNISFICEDEVGKETLKAISLQALYTLITNKAIANPTRLKTQMLLRQHPAPVASSASEPSGYFVNGRQMTLANYGPCPMCDVSIQITDQRIGYEDRPLWNYTSGNSYAMLPVPLEIGNPDSLNDTTSSPTISGFIVKLWQWVNILNGDVHAEGSVFNNRSKNAQYSKQARVQQSRQFQSPPRLTSYTTVHQLQERILLISFTDAGVELKNVSLHNITQLCSHGDNGNVVCQPEVTFQEQSIVIADLGGDGDHELVSFFSTYESVGPDETSSPWYFRSEVHVLPLEVELLGLPKE